MKYLVTQKSNDPRWQFDSFTIGMDPRSRYFDPTDPDGPPMPYDDPASHLYMHCVAGKKAYPCWHSNGDWYGLENPRWKDLLMQYNEMTDDGAIKLTMNGSVCLAQVHSLGLPHADRNDLPLGAGRQHRAFPLRRAVFRQLEHRVPASGAGRAAAGRDEHAVAGQYSVGHDVLVPQSIFRPAPICWSALPTRLSGNSPGRTRTSRSSLLNFSLVQPLLRGGGRVVALKQLTIVERNLLANLRASSATARVFTRR